MLDLTTIILTYNEELHIRRCLENVCQFSKKVIVVDSPSTDRTVEICDEFPNVEVVVHQYPGNQAEQFNWALDNINIETEWILRMDADEYCTSELIKEMEERLPDMPKDVSACVLPLGRMFMGRHLKYGIVNEVFIIRLFRRGCVRYELRLMDEHLKILKGNTFTFDHKFIDASLLSIQQIVDKHNSYSSKGAVQLLDEKYGLTNSDYADNIYADEVVAKKAQKARYAKMPLFWRAFAYFIYRYIFKLGFLDGKEGFCWDFFQGLWYRMLVDAKVYEVKKTCGNDKEKIRQYIKDNYGIAL